MIFDKGTKIIQWEIDILFKKWCWEYPHAKEWIWSFTLYHILSLTQNGSMTNSRAKILKLLEENIGKNFMALSLAMISWIGHQNIKKDKLDFVKIKNLCASKDPFKTVKRQAIEWEKILANHNI